MVREVPRLRKDVVYMMAREGDGRMNADNIVLGDCELKFIECKFTVENDEGLGGDFESNTGGSRKRTRITFDGYCTKELYDELAKAIGKVVCE